LTGQLISRNVEDSNLIIQGGAGYGDSGSLWLCGKNYTAVFPGGFALMVSDAAKTGSVTLLSSNGNTDTPTLNLQSHKIVSVADPTAAQEAATMHYVEYPTVTASAQTSALCYNSETHRVTYNSGVTTCTASTEKNKKNKVTLNETVSLKLMNLTPYKYTLDIDNEIHYGLISEQVVNVFPELAAHNGGDPTNLTGVRYEEFTAVLLKGFQEQKARTDALCAKFPNTC
jgi:hypothetical protein